MTNHKIKSRQEQQPKQALHSHQTIKDGETPNAISENIRLSGIVLSSADPRKLAEFYCRLLHLEPDQNKEHWVSAKTHQGDVRLSFQYDETYQRPAWPTQANEQQTMMHLDFDVVNLEAACKHALHSGAVLADFQPQANVRVFLDPDGHPFCFAG
jgi:hypothetical protein